LKENDLLSKNKTKQGSGILKSMLVAIAFMILAELFWFD